MAATASEKAEYLVRKPPAHRNPAPSIGMAPGTRTRDKRGTVTDGKRSRRARLSARETLLAKPRPLRSSSDRDPRESEQVRHGELAVPGRAELTGLGSPRRLDREIRRRVCREQSDENFRNDPTTDGPEFPALAEDLGLLKDVVEQGRVLAERFQELVRERPQPLPAQDEVLGDSHGAPNRLPRRQAQRLAPLQIPLRQRMDLLRHRLREDAEPEGELRVDLPARLDIEATLDELEETCPLDHVSRRPFAEPAEVLLRRLREDRDVLHLVIQLVLAPDHAVPEPVRAHGEFDGHERPLREVEELQDDLEGVDRLRLGPRGHLEAHGPQNVLDPLVPDEPRKEVVDDRPLIMPPHDPTSLVEPFLGWERRERRGVDHAVVVLEESQRELGDDQILVVAGVPEERAPFAVPGQVLFARLVLPDQEMDAVVFVEEGLVVGPATVDRIEGEPGRAEVDQGVRGVVPLQLRRPV